MFKRAAAVFLAAVMMISLTACGKPPFASSGSFGNGDPASSAAPVESVPAIRPEIKDEIDRLETFMADYVTFMKKYLEAENTTDLLSEYTKITAMMSETMDDIQHIKSILNTYSAEELEYFEACLDRMQDLLDGLEEFKLAHE